jgi:threonine dehydratase
VNPPATPDLHPPTPDEIHAASRRIRHVAIRTPLLRLEPPTGRREIWLKLENLQPIGSFKIRGAANALGLLSETELAQGVFTASAGNMAQGVAWCARAAGVPCTVVVPDVAPRAKLDAIERLGARIAAVPYERWWRVLVERRFDGVTGHFIHPVSDQGVIAGNATIGVEILEDLPDVGSVIVPYGGGGLSCGIASALRTTRSSAPVFAGEVEVAAPLAAALAARAPVSIEHRTSFVDGIGGRALLTEMWPLASTLIAGSCVVSLHETCEAIRTLIARAHMVAEGAGAASLAAALVARDAVGLDDRWVPLPEGPVVCVISGGNIDPGKLAAILEGRVP